MKNRCDCGKPIPLDEEYCSTCLKEIDELFDTEPETEPFENPN